MALNKKQNTHFINIMLVPLIP